jgi:hypothetical protein
VLRGQVLQSRNKEGRQPGRMRYVADEGNDLDPELDSAFETLYRDLRSPRHTVGLREWLSVFPARDGLAKILERGEHLPEKRLRQIRVSMRKLLLDDDSAKLDGDTQQYGSAASRMIANSRGEVTTVIMGHTHLARRVGDSERASYINTGSWTDVVRVPCAALADGADEELEEFLRNLKGGGQRQFEPRYADLRAEANGELRWAKLLPVES